MDKSRKHLLPLLSKLLSLKVIPDYIKQRFKDLESTKNAVRKEKLWTHFLDFFSSALIENNNKDDSNSDGAEKKLAIKLLIKISDQAVKVFKVDPSPAFVKYVSYINIQLDNDKTNLEIQIQMAEFCVNIWGKMKEHLPRQFYVRTLIFYLDTAINSIKSLLKKDITSFRKLASFVKGIHETEPTFYDAIWERIKKLITCKTILSSSTGNEAVAFITVIEEDAVKMVHEMIKENLSKCSKSETHHYGNFYYNLWNLSDGPMRMIVREKCIQDLIFKVIKMSCKKPAIKRLRHNTMDVLDVLHGSRRNPTFSKTMTELYEPILWRSLEDSIATVRCNAAELLIRVYPLEKSKEIDYSILLNKQQEAMYKLLSDNCKTIRVVAIEGMCCNMKYFFDTFTTEIVEQSLLFMSTTLAQDASCALVRRAVYVGFSQLLDNSDIHQYLKEVLPKMTLFIYDKNLVVRRTYLKMLLKIKKSNFDIKFTHILTLKHIAAALEVEEPTNSKLLVKLLLDSIFNEAITIDDTFKRLCKFTLTNYNAVRKLIYYGGKSIPVDIAYKVMCAILILLRKFTKKSFSVENEEEQMEVTDDTSHQNITQDETSEEDDLEKQGQEKPEETTLPQIDKNATNNTMDALNDPKLAHRLMDVVSLLWSAHKESFIGTEEIDKLNRIMVKTLPYLFRYYRGENAFFGALYLSSMLPLSKIVHSCTITSTCISMLNSMEVYENKEQLHCIMHVLGIWNRGSDIIDSINNSLDHAFRTEYLNESAIEEGSNNSKRRKVRFLTMQVTPILALRLLNEIVNSSTDRYLYFKTCPSEIKKLHSFLSKILILIEKRMDKKKELDDKHLTDKFLIECLAAHSKMLILMTDHFKDSCTLFDFIQLLHWSKRTLTNVEESTGDMIHIQLSKVLINMCTNVVCTLPDEISHLVEISKYALEILVGGVNLVENVLILSSAILKNVNAYHEEEINEIVNLTLPKIIQGILMLIAEDYYTKDSVDFFIPNMRSFHSSLSQMLIFYCKKGDLSPKSPSFNVVSSFCNGLISIYQLMITERENLVTETDISKSSSIASLLIKLFTEKRETSSFMMEVFKIRLVHIYSKEPLYLLAFISILHTLAGNVRQSDINTIAKINQTVYPIIRNISGKNRWLTFGEKEFNIVVSSISVLEATDQLISKLRRGD